MNTVSLAGSATVVFEAGQTITLNPGFTVTSTNGGSFTARIADCAASTFIESPVLVEATINETDISINPIQTLAANIYPNPTYQGATLTYSIFKQEEVIIRMYDSNGRLMHYLLPRQMKEKGAHTLPLSTSNLESGIYFIEIQTSQQRLHRKLSVLKG